MNPVSESTYAHMVHFAYGSYVRRWTPEGDEVDEALPRGIAFFAYDVEFPPEHTYGWMEINNEAVGFREAWTLDGWEAHWWPEHHGPWASHWTIGRSRSRDVLVLFGGMTTPDILRIADWIVRKGWPSWARPVQRHGWSTWVKTRQGSA